VKLDSTMTAYLAKLERCQSNPVAGRYFITSFPSPHVAWGVLIVWFGIELYRRSAVLLVPWGLLNCIGAVFLLQHYAVDAVAGIVVAVAAVFLVRGLVLWESALGLTAPSGYGVFRSLRTDAAEIGRAIWPQSGGKVRRTEKTYRHAANRAGRR
jgi:membrane-associated phospholipid phosphatase